MEFKFYGDLKRGSECIELNSEFDISGLLFQLQSIGHEFLGKEYHLMRKNFSSALLTLTVKGGWSILYKDRYFHAEENTILFLDCMQEHESWADPIAIKDDYCSEIFYFHIASPVLQNYCNLVFKSANSPIIPIDSEIALDFIGLYRKIALLISNNAYTTGEASKLLYVFLLKLKEYNENHALIRKNNPYIDKVVVFVSENYNKGITVKDCADYLGLSVNYCESLFAQNMNYSLSQHIANIRLKKSAELLVSTKKSIYEVAIDVGFNNEQSLIRLFKKIFNVTPTEYRNRENAK